MILLLTLAACFDSLTPQTKLSAQELQSKKAEQAAAQISFANNAEIENITRRLELTSQPGLLGYILLINDAGQPIMYTTVKGKITSGSKRLTRSEEYACDEAIDGIAWNSVRNEYGKPFGCGFVTSASDEGTFGSSGPYVYFWTTSNSYIQWSGTYLYSDKPFRLDIKPLVIDIASTTQE